MEAMVTTSKEWALRTLLVDDDQNVLRLLAATLSNLTANVTMASDGETALRLARAQHPDLIILDVRLPKRDGYDVCRILKSDPATSHISIIMLTAMSLQDGQREATEAGADDFLTKPFSPVNLLDKVEQLLACRPLRD